MGKIEKIFERDINRNINGVVKVNQDKDDVIYQELDEYVVTKELNTHIRKFFDCYQQSFQHKTDKVGVWISGFFGSGKSHFLKILGYILQNREASSQGVTKKAVDFFHQKIKDPSIIAAIDKAANTHTDVILFNIDSKADSSGDDKDSILNVFMKVFNEMQGFSSEIPELAVMERFLTEKGQYDQFINLVEEKSGEKWIESRDSFRLDPEDALAAFSEVRGMDIDKAEKWFVDAEENYSLSIESFSKLVRSYLESKGKNHRIIFLVDEIGQYIGDNTSLMLNLQTITENLGSVCEGRAWVAVTSQEDIDAVVGDLKASKANDFSKIQGRFNTRLSLSSSNTDEVIKKRILKKNSSVVAELGSLWKSNKDILRNQLSFSADNATMKFYSDEEDFVDTYPFVTYQFELLQKVFESIRKAGATGKHLAQGERSMLDSFQLAARKVGDSEIGTLVPFYEFYDSISSFLDSIVVRSITQASQRESLTEFDDALLKTLFLIRYVDMVKANIENLVTLCISKVDDDRITLKEKVVESLARLEKENLISSNGDIYSFLTNEEQDISREIRQVKVTQNEVGNELTKALIVEVLDNKSKHRYNRNKKDYAYSYIIDGSHYGHVKENISVEILTPLHDEYTTWGNLQGIANTSEGSNRVIFKLAETGESLKLTDEISKYLQTERYIKQKNSPTNSESIKRILSERGTENRARRKRISMFITEMFTKATIFSVGKEYENKGSTSEPLTLLSNVLDYLIDNTYKKLTLLQSYCTDLESSLRSIFSSSVAPDLGIEAEDSNHEAIIEAEQYLSLKFSEHTAYSLKEMADKFNGAPWGWPVDDTVILASKLFRHRRIRFVYKQADLDFSSAAEVLRKTRNWNDVILHKEEVISERDKKKVISAIKDCFDEVPPSNTEKLIDYLDKKFHETERELLVWRNEAAEKKYPTCERVTHYYGIFKRLAEKTSSSAAKFIEAIANSEDDLIDYSEDIPNIQSFHKTQSKLWNEARRFKSDKTQNSSHYDSVMLKDWQELDAILSDRNPYSKISQLRGLLDSLTKSDAALLEENREKYLAQVNSLISKLQSLIEESQLKGQDSNFILYPIQQLKKTIEATTAIDSLIAKASQAEAEYDRSCGKIQHLLDERQQSEKPQTSGNSPSVSAVKSIATVHAKNCCSKVYLETADEVETYVKTLKEAILTEIDAGKRVQVK